MNPHPIPGCLGDGIALGVTGQLVLDGPVSVPAGIIIDPTGEAVLLSRGYDAAAIANKFTCRTTS